MIQDIKNKFKSPHIYKSLTKLLETYVAMHANMPKHISRNIGDSLAKLIEECIVISYQAYVSSNFEDKLKALKELNSNLSKIKLYIDVCKNIKAISERQQGNLYQIIGNIEMQLEKYEKYVIDILSKQV